jgi:hypothetical protein
MFTSSHGRLRAITLGAAILFSSVGAVLSVPAGATPTTSPALPQTAAAQAAASWLGGQFTPDGFIPLSDSDAPDLTSTVNSVLALAAANVDATTAQSGLTFLQANFESYVAADGNDGPGQLSLLILIAEALGANPHQFGGTLPANDLVARLLATEQTSGPNTGLFGTDAQVADFLAGPYDQGLALAALKAAGVTADAPSIAYLVGQQCPDGGWATPDIANNSCTVDPTNFTTPGPDTNATSLAIEGLAAQGALTTPVSTNALGFLEGAQDTDDAGWGYSPNPDQTPGNSDPDSTSLVIQALIAMGQSPTSATFTQGGATPVSTLLGFVVNSGPDTGAISSPFGLPTTGNLLATYQTVPALAGLAFPLAVAPAPVVAGLSTTTGSVTGGTSVVITGLNLNALSVTFGSTPSPSFIVNSDTSITAIAPAAALPGPVDVTVTSFGGTSATSDADLFTYEPTSGSYQPLTPLRICDTRPVSTFSPANQCNSDSSDPVGPIGAGAFKTINVANAQDAGSGSFGVPANATAVVLNVTAVTAAAPGFLTIFPSGATPPTASNLNFATGETVPNLVEVGVGTGGDITIFSSSETDLLVDVEGYSASNLPAGAGLYNPVSSPIRLCDTRAMSGFTAPNQCNGPGPAAGTLPAGGTQTVQVTDGTTIPNGATAAVLNVTVVNPSASGFVTVYPEGGSQPNASNINYAAGQTTSNRVIVPLSSAGGVTAFSSAATDLIVDVSGYYSAAAGSGSQFTAAADPVRICDTRTTSATNACTGRAIGPGGVLTLSVAGVGGAPAHARAVVINLTGVTPTQDTFLSVFPGPRMPTTSDLNLAAGDIGASMVVATISSTGTISITNHSGTTDVVVDVLGWYAAAPV